MKYTLNDKIFYKINKLGLGKVENYIATKRSPKYIEMVREEIKKIDPNNLEDTKKLKEFIEDKVPDSIRKTEKFMLTLLKENKNLPNVRKVIANANCAIDNKKVMTEIFKYSEANEIYPIYMLDNDKDFVLSILKNNYKGFRIEFNISDNLKNDREVMLEACRYYNEKAKILKYYSIDITKELGPKLKKDKEFVLEVCNKSFDEDSRLEKLIEIFNNDKKFILNMLNNKKAYMVFGGEEFDGEPIDEKHVIVLNKVSDRLKNDKEVVFSAMKADCGNIEFMSKKLKNDKKFILTLLNSEEVNWHEQWLFARFGYNGLEKSPLYYLSENLKNDKEIALKMVKKDMYNLYYVSDTLKNNNDFMLKVLNMNFDPHEKGLVEKFFEKNLENNKDKDVLLARSNVSFFELTEEQKLDKDLALKVLSTNGYQLKYFTSEKIKSDKDIVLAAIHNYSEALKWASNSIKNDPEVVLLAVDQNITNLKYASNKIKNNKEEMLKIFKYSNRFYDEINLYNSKEIPTQLLGDEIKNEYFKDKGEVTYTDLIKILEKAIQKENETKTPEKVTTVEKKVENSKSKETSKEKPTRSRIRSTGNER